MGYLSLAPEGGSLDFTKMVISFWFRVPQASIDAARAKFAVDAAADDPIPPMSGIVPLIQFDPASLFRKRLDSVEAFSTSYNTTNKSWFSDAPTSGTPHCSWHTYHTGTVPINGYAWQLVDDHSAGILDPSFIGIDCRTDRTIFSFNLQYDESASVNTDSNWYDNTGYTTSGTKDIYDSLGTPPLGGCQPDYTIVENPPGTFTAEPAPSVGGTWTQTNTYVANEAITGGQQRFGTVGQNGSPGYGWGTDGLYVGPDDPYQGAGKTVSADEWHHAILSFDLRDVASTGSINTSDDFTTSIGTVDSTSTIFVSFDDVNLTKKQISLYNDGVENNEFLTQQGFTIYRELTHPDGTVSFDTTDGFTLDTVTEGLVQPEYEFTPPPLPVSLLNIPGNTDSTLLIEMAEMQIFIGVTLDTSVTDNRRAFVTSGGTPAAQSLATALLGKTPEVYLHGSADFKAGVNRGSLGPLSPTGTINPFTPGPDLTPV